MVASKSGYKLKKQKRACLKTPRRIIETVPFVIGLIQCYTFVIKINSGIFP